MFKNKLLPEIKIMIVKEYLAGGTSYVKLGRKYKIDESSIRKWVDKFQAFGEKVFEINCANLKYSAEFKKKIVAAYLNKEGSYKDIAIRFKIIEHNNNYAETALKYKVSYQQVYSWIKKYQKQGIEALQDRRGKAKCSFQGLLVFFYLN